MSEKEWIIDVNDANLIKTPDKAKLVFSEAKEMLAASLESHTALTTKASTILGIIVGLSVGLVAYFLKGPLPAGESLATLTLVEVFTVCAGLSIASLTYALFPRQVYVPGYNPRQLFVDKMMKKSEIKIYRCLIKRYGEEITYNENMNWRIGLAVSLAQLLFLAGSTYFVWGYLSLKSAGAG